MKTCLEMLGRFVIGNIGLFIIPQMEMDKFPEVLACIMILVWLFIPMIELIKKDKEKQNGWMAKRLYWNRIKQIET